MYQGQDTGIAKPRKFALDIEAKLHYFVQKRVIPSEKEFLTEVSTWRDRFTGESKILERLKQEAKSLGLWNLFLPEDAVAGVANPRLTAAEYARMAEIMGWSPLGSLACNCSAPDTGNMELLLSYGTEAQKERWLKPLLNGEIRSAFLMTEPAVASSDARNIATTITREGDEYVITGNKWWATGAPSSECKILFVMGKTDASADPLHQQSIVLIPKDAPGVVIKRPLTVFGYDDAPEGHAEIELREVRIPVSNLLGKEGAGFEMAQSRLGRGRIHHCMRAIGIAERCMEAILQRVTDPSRRPFGRALGEHATVQADIAECRLDIYTARLAVMHAATLIDKVGAKAARKEIAMIKVLVPRLVLRTIDRGIQIYGAAGVSEDTVLARAWAGMRTLRIADGPDIVHIRTIALLELRDHLRKQPQATAESSLPPAKL